MKIFISPSPEEASRKAASMIRDAVTANPASVLGLATGSTPVRLYELLIEACQAGLDFSQVRTFNLDEYCGIAPDHVQSYRRFMNEKLFNHINIKAENTFIPNGLAADVAAHAAEFEKSITDMGGIDIQILGIGTNGHIGFNEPGSSLVSRTRKVTLTQQTVSDNARFFDSIDDVPKYAISMGVGTIMEAKKCFMLCFGKGKATAVRSAVEGGISQFNPASALQMHPDATLFLDEAAASELELKDYYHWVTSNPE